MQARELIAYALIEIGVVDGVDALDPADAALALQYLRGLVDTFQADGYLTYGVTTFPFTLTPSQQTYTLGDGGDFDTNLVRPLWIVHAGITPAGDTTEIPLDRWSRGRWLAERQKGLTDLWPSAVNYEPTSDLLGTLSFWPKPTSAPALRLSLPTPLTTLVDLDTDLAFAPGGYERAYRLNLAKELQRPFTKPRDPELARDAMLALGVIKRVNDPGPPRSRADSAVTGRGGYDIRSGTYRGGGS